MGEECVTGFFLSSFLRSHASLLVSAGTNMGAASVDMGTGRISWILHGKSDVFALQFIHSVIHFVLVCVCT